MNVVEIIEEVFDRFGFGDFETGLVQGHHPQREYCVQYRESAYDFVSRLTEEEGIFWYFKHENGKHTLVLPDGTVGYFDCPEREVDFPRDAGTRAIEDHITSWEHRYEFRTGSWSQADYNFKTPSHNLMTNEQSIINMPGMRNYEFYDYPGLYPTGDDGRSLTKVRLEEQEAEHDVVQAESLCKTFTPGGKFTIREHLASQEEGKTKLITTIQHTATEPSPYETGATSGFEYKNKITCIPDDVVFRPARTTARPIVEGPQTAVIVGPAGEEIYTDEHARVKVQFHWDRVGGYDQSSCCWMRVSQVHAGKGWGAVDLPRVGEEVIVDFLEGNPDRPIISGRVYNAEHMPPFPLDKANNATNKTRRGNKTKTYKGSGFNEMSMDDTPGKEQIRMNAQYNMDSAVGNNQTLKVGVDRSGNVGNNDALTVGNDSTENVGNNKKLTVGNNQNINVGNKLVINAGSSITLKCGASKIYMNSGGVINITGTIITTAAAANASVVAPLTQVVGGAMLTTMGGVNVMSGGVVQVYGGLASISGGKVDVAAAGTTSIKGGTITLN